MKRSEINKCIKEFEAILNEHKFVLPPFLHFTPEEWAEKGHEYDEIRDNALGWDITDYGEGHFYDGKGLYLITLRNGNVHNDKYTKVYAEKIMMLKEGQISPNHFHWNKMEDIINRGGGNIVFRLWNATKDEGLDDTDVKIFQDGRCYTVPAGSEIILHPGESLTLYPYYYHEFCIQPGTGYALIGEVSMCNDDNTDNRFLEASGRFPTVEEDEAPYRLLCTEYPPAKD